MLLRVKQKINASVRKAVRPRIVNFRSAMYTLSENASILEVLEEERIKNGDPLLLNPNSAYTLGETYEPIKR